MSVQRVLQLSFARFGKNRPKAKEATNAKYVYPGPANCRGARGLPAHGDPFPEDTPASGGWRDVCRHYAGTITAGRHCAAFFRLSVPARKSGISERAQPDR